MNRSYPTAVVLLFLLAVFAPLAYGSYYYSVHLLGHDSEDFTDDRAFLADPARAHKDDLTKKLRRRLANQGVQSVDPGPDFGRKKEKLGQFLFYDSILSGNKDVSCATCHNPATATTDGLSLALGTKARGSPLNRRPNQHRSGDGNFNPRNTPDLFNRGSLRWKKMFWANRTIKTDLGTYVTISQHFVGHRLNHILAAQAITDVMEEDYRGRLGDTTVFGQLNEIALLPVTSPHQVWRGLMDRVLSIPRYQTLFEEAFPDVPEDELRFEHAGSAIAAYEIEAFTFLNSPWDRFLEGKDNALSRPEKKGALLFYGKAGCGNCHAGPLMTDQEVYNIGVPPLGPGGNADFEAYDLGQYHNTKDPEDMFKFRTPPLRNVTETGPWMHNGSYKTLEGAVRHHFNPIESIKNYDPGQLQYDLRAPRELPLNKNQLEAFPTGAPGKNLMNTVARGPTIRRIMKRTLSEELSRIESLTSKEFENLMTFLKALTSPSVDRQKGLNNPETPGPITEELLRTIPDTVPSGLPIDLLPER